MLDPASLAVANTVESQQVGQIQKISINYNTSLNDISAFEESLANAQPPMNVSAPSEAARAAFKPLEYINNEAAEIVNYAKNAVESGNELTPSEVVMLTARSHEFMFHCQLTSNVANRTSEGLQQLFRQQS